MTPLDATQTVRSAPSIPGSGGKAPGEDIRPVVEEFEALLLADVLKNLRSSMSGGLSGGGDGFGGEATAGDDAIREMAEQQMVRVLASRDVLGLVQSLGSQLSAAPKPPSAAPS
jgi:Rod binding domain-containing protein